MGPGGENEAGSNGPHPGRRIVVVGKSGSGKTTLGGQLARALGVPHVELDAIHWKPNWEEERDEVFRSRVSEELSGDGWVVDGNYNKVRDIMWGRADTVVWLDYPLSVVFRRLAVRTLRRGILRTELWNGNRERLWEHLIPSQSLFVWAVKQHRTHRREYPAVLNRPEYRHLCLIHLRTPAETERWLAGLR